MAEQFTIPTEGDLIADKYRVLEELGRGAYGVVFLCNQEDLGRRVAVKTLLPQAFLQSEVVNRFHREAQLISRLDHPNIIRLFDYGVDDGLLYMTVEYVLGRTLSDIIEKDAPLDATRVLNIVRQILDALDHAHSAGIVHRDLKPANIVILESDGTLEVKVLDFGISKMMLGDDLSAMNTLTQDGTVLGTPHYMSPENIVGDPVDHRADLYSLGIIIYEMLLGEHPYDAPNPSAVFVRHLRDEPPVLPGDVRSQPLGIAAQRALEKQPEDRIESAAMFREWLNADPVELAAQTQERRTPIWAWVVAAFLAVILGVSVGWKVWLAARGPAPQPPIADTVSSDPVRDSVEPKPVEVVPTELAIRPELVSAVAASETLLHQSLRFALASAVDAAETTTRRESPRKNKTVRPKPKEERKQTELPTPPEVAPVRLTISSSPPNAKVLLNNVPIGSTPIVKTFDDADKTIRLTFKHIGFESKSVQVQPKVGSVTVKLKKKMIELGD